MPKLLFVVTGDWCFVSHRLALASAEQDIGFKVAVATRCDSHCGAIERAGFKVIFFAMSPRGY